MGSHLLGRYARLLCRSSSQASAAATRLPLPLAGPTKLQGTKGWLWVTDRLLCEKIFFTKEDICPVPPTCTQLDELLEKAEEPEDVLLAWAEYGGTSNQAAVALTTWTRLVLKRKKMFPVKYKPDSILVDIMTTLSKEVSTVWNTTLLYVLRSLWVMGIPPTDSVLNSVRTEVIWRLHRLTYRHLGLLAEWGADRTEQQDMALMTAVLKHLELRWTEITDTRTVIGLIAKGNRISPSLRDKVEDKALELADNFSAQEIRKVFVSLAVQGRRSVPLLRALCYYLLQKPSPEFTTPLIMDVAFACGRLSFDQSKVFQRLAIELLPRVPGLTPFDVTRCAKSLSFVKWINLPLFEAFAKHYTANSKAYHTSQLCNLLVTFARLGFQPSNRVQFFNEVHGVLEETLSDLEPFLQTHVAWSLCVLQQEKPYYLIPLTQPDHVTKLSEGTPAQVVSYKLMLLHIATTLHFKHPGSSDTPLNPLLVSATTTSPLSALQISLREALRTLVGGRTETLRTGVHTKYGWTIDGELVIDCDNKPVDLSMLKADHLPSGGGEQALPVGARRIAFLAWDYPNFTQKSKDLLGRFRLKKQHLQLAGFITVEVPYYEWLQLRTEWQKLAYLKDKMGKAVAEDMAK